jgi:hypothetical protein
MQITLDDGDLEPLITKVVAKVLAQREVNGEKLGDRLAYNEAEAAALLGVKAHVLRDCRLRGELVGSKVGKRVMYSRDTLLKFLAANQLKGW